MLASVLSVPESHDNLTWPCAKPNITSCLIHSSALRPHRGLIESIEHGSGAAGGFDVRIDIAIGRNRLGMSAHTPDFRKRAVNGDEAGRVSMSEVVEPQFGQSREPPRLVESGTRAG